MIEEHILQEGGLPASTSANFGDAVMAGLRRLEEGQKRVESQLRQIQNGLQQPLAKRDTDGNNSFLDISSAFEESQSAMTNASAAKERPSAINKVGAENENPELAEKYAPADNQPHHQHGLEEALAQQEEESEIKAKDEYMSREYHEILKKQEDAHKALFRARNHARGWMLDEDENIGRTASQAAGGHHGFVNPYSFHIKSWVVHCIDSGSFDMAFGSIIFLNAMVMLLRIEQQGQRIGYDENFGHAEVLQFVRAESPLYEIHDSTYAAIEICFIACFSLELVLRLWVRHCRFFANSWNILDTVLVAVAYMDLASTQMPVDFTVFRLLRLLRLTRALRVLRVMRSFKPLRLLVATLWNSMFALVWSVMLVGLILLMGACLMGALLQGTIGDDSIDYAVREEVWRKWGTAGHAYNTLFRWTLSGTWSTDIDLLILGVGPMFGLFIYSFVVVVNFALIRVVSAVFIKETFNAAQKDSDAVLEETMRKDGKKVVALKAILEEFAEASNGNLTQDEFEKALSDRRCQVAMEDLEIEWRGAGSLFILMDNGRGVLSCDEIVSGAMTLRGDAKAVDIASIMYENAKSMLVVRSIEQHCHLLVKLAEYTAAKIDDVGHRPPVHVVQQTI